MSSPKRRQTGAQAQTGGGGHGGSSPEEEAYEHYVRKQIKSGLADIKAGRVISHEKMLQKFGMGTPGVKDGECGLGN